MLDLYKRPQLLYKYKIQPTKRFDRRDLPKLVRNLLLNSLCIYDPVGLPLVHMLSPRHLGRSTAVRVPQHDRCWDPHRRAAAGLARVGVGVSAGLAGGRGAAVCLWHVCDAAAGVVLLLAPAPAHAVAVCARAQAAPRVHGAGGPLCRLLTPARVPALQHWLHLPRRPCPPRHTAAHVPQPVLLRFHVLVAWAWIAFALLTTLYHHVRAGSHFLRCSRAAVRLRVLRDAGGAGVTVVHLARSNVLQPRFHDYHHSNFTSCFGAPRPPRCRP